MAVLFGVLAASLVGLWMFSQVGFLLGLILMVVVCPVVFALGVLVGMILETIVERPARKAEEERKQIEWAKNAALKARIAQERDDFFSELSGWNSKSLGQILNLADRPKCMMAMGADGLLIRLIEYHDEDEFSVQADYTYSIRQVVSLGVASPSVKKTAYTTQAVPIITKENRSPVARGLVGGALLGPVGLVVGAASGLNSKVTTHVEERRIAQTIDGLGEPQLIMGLNDIDRPLLKIQFNPSSLADEWNYRIRAAQSQR